MLLELAVACDFSAVSRTATTSFCSSFADFTYAIAFFAAFFVASFALIAEIVIFLPNRKSLA